MQWHKEVIALNDPKEMNFNDILAEASSCFMRSIPNRSMEKYREALKFNKKNVNTCDEVVVIKFMFARWVCFIIYYFFMNLIISGPASTPTAT